MAMTIVFAFRASIPSTGVAGKKLLRLEKLQLFDRPTSTPVTLPDLPS
jgi:hypothetical protein